MQISVDHHEVEAFARNLKDWASQMLSTHHNILMRVQQLETQWSDPQYRMFVEIAQTQSKTLKSAVDQFEVMSDQLASMARMLEHTKREMENQIRSMQR